MDIVPEGPIARKKRQTFFRLAWGQTSGIVCLAIMSGDNKKRFREEFYSWPQEENLLLSTIEENVRGNNLYFCPQLLREKKRTKECVLETSTIWADLDFCPPEKVFVPPSLVMETSPMRYQALWRIDPNTDTDEAEDLSKRIAYKHAEEGADKSGWDLTQLLRVPLSYNYKYTSTKIVPVVQIVSVLPGQYRLKDFDMYPATAGFEVEDVPMPKVDMSPGVGEQVLLAKKLKLSPIVVDLFTSEPDSDWSVALWRMLLMLFEADFTEVEVFQIANDSACNKYARDNKPLRLLWKEVQRAKAKAELHAKLLVPSVDEFNALLTLTESVEVETAGDTFIERYMQWASGLGDAATQYHQAGAFVALSSLLAGSVRLPTSFGTFHPNIWFMILADTTLTRKSTAMDIAMDLVADIDDDLILATDGSLEGLLGSLSTRPGKPSIFLRDEFSGLLEAMTKKDYMAGMPELLTKLYDGKLQKRVLRKEVIEVKDPRLIVFAGGIKTKITGLLTYDMVSSGFMPRFVFITAESDLSRVKPIGPPTIQSSGNRDAIVSELLDIAKYYNRTQTLSIENSKITIQKQQVTNAVMSDEAWMRYNKLETQMLDRGLKHERPEIMTPVGDRLAKSMLKAALLIAAARQKNEEIKIELIDILRAIKYGEQWAAHSLEVMNSVGKGSAERQLDNIATFVRRKPEGVTRSAIMQSYHLTARDASNLFDTLEQRGMIKRIRTGKAELILPTSENMKELLSAKN